MIIAKSDTPCDNDWQWDDAKENYLLSLLDNTIYSESKKKRFEYLIQGGLEQAEYENFKMQFWNDKVDQVTMRSIYGMTELKRHLGKLR